MFLAAFIAVHDYKTCIVGSLVGPGNFIPVQLVIFLNI